MEQKNKDKIINDMQTMPYNTWFYFNQFTEEEKTYIIWCIQNQQGNSFETNGESYKPETHIRFRKLDTNYQKYLNIVK